MNFRHATLILVGLSGLAMGCGEGADLSMEDENSTDSVTQGVSVNSQAALDWANDWLGEVKASPSTLDENVYTSSYNALERASGSRKARNRNVCGTLVTNLLQKSIGLAPDDFYNSFNKAMTSCSVGTVNGVQKGTNSPNAQQYQYKIAHCPTTGPIKFNVRSTIGSVRTGDVLAVAMPERSDISGHVMIVRKSPVADSSLPSGPSDTTAYAVEIIDSTSTPHTGNSKHPDWRGGNTGQGLGYGTFVLYAKSTGAIVASRWSPTDGTRYSTADHPISIGGLQ